MLSSGDGKEGDFNYMQKVNSRVIGSLLAQVIKQEEGVKNDSHFWLRKLWLVVQPERKIQELVAFVS